MEWYCSKNQQEDKHMFKQTRLIARISRVCLNMKWRMHDTSVSDSWGPQFREIRSYQTMISLKWDTGLTLKYAANALCKY